MVSKASEDFPDPDTPVITVSWFLGMSTSMFFKLCSRAPRTDNVVLLATPRPTGATASGKALDFRGDLGITTQKTE